MKTLHRPRPIRVAFLVEDGEHSKQILDAIFADCYSRWGGRFNLVVPVQNGDIPPQYLAWLDLYDPDFIYSYVDLDPKILADLHERIGPSFLMLHHILVRGSGDKDFRPSLPVLPLSSLTVSLITINPHPLYGRQPLLLVDHHDGGAKSRFIQENFGYVKASQVAWTWAAHLEEYALPLTVVTPELAADRRLSPMRGETVQSDDELIVQIARKTNIYGLAQLSSWVTPRIELQTDDWSHAVTVIVGNSFTDRVTFWNARSLYPSGYDQQVVILSVTPEELENDSFFSSFLELIRGRAWVSGSGSQSHIIIRSASLSATELVAVRDRFNALKTSRIFQAQPIESVIDCVPPIDALNNAAQYVDYMPAYRLSPWTETEVGTERFKLPNTYPKHLREVSRVPNYLQNGAWAVDVDLERKVDHSPYINVTHRWRLGRRIPAVEAFVRSHQIEGSGRYCNPRISKGGLITIYGGCGSDLPEIDQPSDEELFRHALCAHRRPWPFKFSSQQPNPPLVWAFQPSDKGRYLSALLHRAGGLSDANAIFMSGFWKNQFERLGSTSAGTETRVSQVISTLKSRLSTAEPSEGDEWERLARVVLKEAKELRIPPRYLRFDQLEQEHGTFVEAFYERLRQAGQKDIENRSSEEKTSLALSLQYLCQLEILHQGHEWLCARCCNNNWVSIDNFKSTLECEVCGSPEPAPVSQIWKFKMNEFILEGLREHGLLASLWCLIRLREQSKTSFYFCGPHNLYYGPHSAEEAGKRRKADAEIDLLAVTDGVVRLVEVKSGPRKINYGKLIDVATRLRPDIVTLAVMDDASPGLHKGLDHLREKLSPLGIDAELMFTTPHDLRDDPYLPYLSKDYSLLGHA